MEIWKDIPGYERFYQASSLGRIKSLERYVRRGSNYSKTLKKENMLRPGIASSGRLMVVLSVDKKSKSYCVHQLVAMAFLGHKPMGYKLVVDHIDNNPLNNNLNNLQIITQRQNVHKIKRKTFSKYIGVCRYKNNLWQSAISINGKVKHLGHFKSEYDAHLAYKKELNKLGTKN